MANAYSGSEWIIRFSLLCLSLLFAGTALCQPPRQASLPQLRHYFINSIGGDFEFVKGESKSRLEAGEAQSYWLAHVKPKRTGIFTLKYAFRFDDKFYASGETEMKFAVNGRSCSRYPQIVRDIAYFCLGDTIIIPIRLHKYSQHTFSLESRYAEPEDIEKMRRFTHFYLNRLKTEQAPNPIESNLKYLGIYQTEELFRSGGGIFTHYAVFEARRAGRFNLGLSVNAGDRGGQASRPPGKTIPIVIVDPGTPVASLMPLEKATYYIKDRSYSSGYVNKFETDLLILQTGEVFSISFSSFREEPFWKSKSGTERAIKDPRPVIYKLPFSLNKTVGFNEWIR